MPLRRQFPARSFEAEDVRLRRVDPHYVKILIRCSPRMRSPRSLPRSAINARWIGRQRAAADNRKKSRRRTRHAAIIYRALAKFGVTQEDADRSMIPALKAPSFEAPLRFAKPRPMTRPTDGEAQPRHDRAADDRRELQGFQLRAARARRRSHPGRGGRARAVRGRRARELGRAFRARGGGGGAAQWLPAAANFFGPPGSGFTYDCMRYGLKVRDNGELAELYLSMLERRVGTGGLAMPRLTSGYPHALA